MLRLGQTHSVTSVGTEDTAAWSFSLPPVTAAATTSRTGRHRRSYFEGRGEVVNSLVFFATGSRRHHRRLQLPLPPPPHVRAAAAAAAGRGEDLSIWFLLWLGCSRVWMLCFWAVLADLGPDALDFGPNKQRSGAKLYAF